MKEQLDKVLSTLDRIEARIKQYRKFGSRIYKWELIQDIEKTMQDKILASARESLRNTEIFEEADEQSAQTTFKKEGVSEPAVDVSIELTAEPEVEDTKKVEKQVKKTTKRGK